MKPKKLILQVMLWSLGIAAAAGVLAMMLPGNRDIVWRLVGTGILTGIATALLLPLSWLVDRAKTRSAGLLAMGSIVVAFFLFLILIWDLRPLGVNEEKFGFTALFLILSTPVAMTGLRMMQTPMCALAGKVGVVVAAAFYGLTLLSIWGYDYAWRGEKCLFTAASVGAFGILAAICLVNAGWSARRYWPWLGVLAALVGGGMALVHIWADTKGGAGLFAVITSLAFVIAHANLAVLAPLKDPQRWVRIGTVAMVLVTAAVLDVYIIFDEQGATLDGLERIAGAAGIVAGCGSMALLVLSRMNRQVEYEPESFAATEISLTCPRCGKKHTLPLGDAACPDCRLRILVRIEEPRCPQCGYLLYKLTSDHCPECGTKIGAAPVESAPPETVQRPDSRVAQPPAAV